jgi:hypothetical protein
MQICPTIQWRKSSLFNNGAEMMIGHPQAKQKIKRNEKEPQLKLHTLYKH